LSETFTFGGNSGSPLYFYKSPFRTDTFDVKKLLWEYKLAGVIRGYYPNYNPLKKIKTKQTQNDKTVSSENTGIALVTPSAKLIEILQTEELKLQRIMMRDYFKNQKK
jgi:hypothetical protein